MRQGERIFACAFAAAILLATAGCQTDSRQQALATTASQVQLRSFQTRAFDTADRQKTLRTVMATMQDLGFVLDKADAVLGTVSGTKFGKAEFDVPYQVRMTVTVRPRSEKQLLVRANAQFGLQAIEDPKPFQDFFAALQKSMFLTAHQVD
jgi:hypothetical protein